MHQNDLDQLRLIARFASEKNRRLDEHTDPGATKRANLLILVAKCGEIIARHIYGINTAQYLKG
jgi:hypothetical protein